MNLVIIIPAYNPPVNFTDLLLKIREITPVMIIIIDDCSQKPIEINVKISNIELYRNSENKGKGGALKKGFHIAYEGKYTHAITMDADFQHSPYFINDFVCIKPDISIVYGKRNLLHPMPLHRIISNYITSKIISFVFMAEVYDSQCGFRRYKLEDINKIIVYENGYQYETEILIKSIKMNLSISPVPISTIYSNEISNLPFIKNILSFAKLIIILRIYD